jgi:hypothetical protein
MDEHKIYDYRTIAYKSKIHPFKATVAIGNSRNFSQNELSKLFRRLIDIQRKMYNNNYISGEILRSSFFNIFSEELE